MIMVALRAALPPVVAIAVMCVCSPSSVAQAPPAVPQAATPATVYPEVLGAAPGETALLPRLKGVALYATADAAKAGTPGPGITFQGLPLLQTDDFTKLVSLAAALPASKESLDRLALATRLYLSGIGYPFSIVYLPPQDITNGIVRFVVTVSRLQGEVDVQGARYFAEQQYRNAIHQVPGQPLNLEQLNADLDWINRNEYRAAKATTVAGTEPGTTKILVTTEEKLPLTVTAGADNTGTHVTNENRVNTGIKWGNAFGLGDTLSAQWATSPDIHTFESVNGSYAIDLPWHHIFTLSGAYSRTNGVVAAPFSLQGQSWQLDADYQIPFAPTASGYTSSLTFGIDFKSSNNNFLFSTIPVSNTPTAILQARVTYTGGLVSRFGATAFDMTLVGAPGDLLPLNNDAAFNLSRANAKADYLYVRGNASQTVPLDNYWSGLSWFARGKFQLSDHNLLGSEQFQGGGVNAVRGYNEDAVYKENGILISQEIRFPSLKLPNRHLPSQVQPFLFQDYAHLQSTVPLPGEKSSDLHGAGIGLTLMVGDNFNLRIAYGWQLHYLTTAGNSDHSRFHFSGGFSF